MTDEPKIMLGVAPVIHMDGKRRATFCHFCSEYRQGNAVVVFCFVHESNAKAFIERFGGEIKKS